MAVYEYKTRIRYSEIDSEGFLTPVAMLDLLQNTSTFQSEDLGMGPEYLKEHNTAWVLNSWQVCINKMPVFGDEVTVQTWSYGIKGMLGFRNFRILSTDGGTLVYANSVWAYVNTKTLSPVRCSADEVEKYGKSEQLEMECAPRKISLPEVMEEREPFEVKQYFIDTNHHMNNSKYVLSAMDYLPDDFPIREIRAEYKKSAHLHDMIYPKVSDVNAESGTGDGERVVTVTLNDSEGSGYATIQFR